MNTRDDRDAAASVPLIDNVQVVFLEDYKLLGITMTFDDGVALYTICSMDEDLFAVLDAMVLKREKEGFQGEKKR